MQKIMEMALRFDHRVEQILAKNVDKFQQKLLLDTYVLQKQGLQRTRSLSLNKTKNFDSFDRSMNERLPYPIASMDSIKISQLTDEEDN